jgi:hypothetical protein
LLVLASATLFDSSIFVESAFAQSTTVSIAVDINGVRVASAPTVSPKDGEKSQYSESANGRLIPQEQKETHVLSESPNEKVTETWLRKYDNNGQLLYTERTLTTERKTPDGGKSTTESVYRGDLNGGMAEKERRSIETRRQDAKTVATEVTIAGAGNNGGFETIEQHKIVTTTEKISDTKSTQHEDETVYQRSVNGGLVANRRTVTESQTSGDKTDTSVAKYEGDIAGRMTLRQQETSTATVSKDGKLVLERNLYNVAPEGSSDAGTPKLIEVQSVVRTPTADGVTETVNVRRASLDDAGALGPPTQLSETVCTGKCEALKAPAGNQ